ncbi:MAG: PLDc N-terminal domain-containing protein [Victivallales bacterium]
MLELIMAVFLGGIFFWLLMLTDWHFHEPKGADRTIWLLLIVLLNIIGAFAYLCLRYRDNRKKIDVSVGYATEAVSEDLKPDDAMQSAEE